MMNRLRALGSLGSARKIFIGTLNLNNFVEVMPEIISQFNFCQSNFNAKAQRRGDAKHLTQNFNRIFSFATLRLGVFALNPFPFRHRALTSPSLWLARVRLTWQHGEPDFARG
jgi:hypothetical protein